MTKDAKFGRAQILDIVFRKWFPVNLSFQILEDAHTIVNK